MPLTGTPRRPMLLAIVVLTLICSIVGMYELACRTEHFRTEAEYCRQSEQGMRAGAAELESLASDPSRETELPFALFKRTRWSRGQALEMELESAVHICRTETLDHWLPELPRSRRWKQLASEAKRVATQDAQTCRRMSEYYVRERMRYERVVAYSSWLPLEPDRPTPES